MRGMLWLDLSNSSGLNREATGSFRKVMPHFESSSLWEVLTSSVDRHVVGHTSRVKIPF